MTSAHTTQVNDKNYESEVVKSDKLVLIDFYADWCGPCKSMAPTLEKFAEENKDKVKVVKVNIEESPRLAAAFGVKSIPTLVTLKDGVAIYGAVGAVPKSSLEKLVAESLKSLETTPGSKPQPPRNPKI